MATWPGVGWLSFGIISLRYGMTSELNIDMNLLFYGAYCHEYQTVYKTLEFRNRARNWTSSKSVNRLARHFGENKSTYDSANFHKSSSLSSKWAAIFLVRSLFRVYPTDNGGVTFGELFRDNPRFAFAVDKTMLFLVPRTTRNSRGNSSFKNRAQDFLNTQRSATKLCEHIRADIVHRSTVSDFWLIV